MGIKIKEITVMVPADKWFGLMYPECCNSISAEYSTAFLVCPNTIPDSDITAIIDSSSTDKRSRLVTLLTDEVGHLFAVPYFPLDNSGHWEFGGAYLSVPVEPQIGRGCGYSLNFTHVTVPLHDFWVYAPESEAVDDFLPF